MDPVLPWGRTISTNDSVIDHDLPRTKNLILGKTRVEVYWKIDSEDPADDPLPESISMARLFRC